MMASDGGVVTACRCNLIEALYTGWSMWTGRNSLSITMRAAPLFAQGKEFNVMLTAEC